MSTQSAVANDVNVRALGYSDRAMSQVEMTTQWPDRAIQREIAGLTEADVNPAALSETKLDSLSRRIAQYQSNRLALVAAVDAQNDAYVAYQRLSAMSPAQIASDYASGEYDTALSNATSNYLMLRENAAVAQQDTYAALILLSDGRELSTDVMRELNTLPGF